MFTAAATVGVATRPLLLFYGLSQGGRAVSAAARDVHNNDYPLTGHGIKATSLVGTLAEVRVYGDNTEKSSFTRLSKILSSSVWGEKDPVAVGELWNTLPEARAVRLDHPLGARPLPVAVNEHSVLSQSQAAPPVELIVSGIPSEIMPPPQHEGAVPALEAFLGRYPKLAGYTAMYPKGVYPDGQGGTVHLEYPSSHTSYHERTAAALAHTTRYRQHDRYAFPAVGANTDSVHPVMAWWAVLFALSMLARYHPDAWAKHIAVDISTDAVRIEHLLAEALTAVPELLLQTIIEVSR